MNWDPFQRDALEAMGLRLYEVRDAHAPAEVPPAPAADAPARPRDEAQAEAQAEAPAAAAVDTPLLRALARAAGRSADDPEALALCGALLPPGGLRDVASRRALWRRLRALRAGSRR